MYICLNLPINSMFTCVMLYTTSILSCNFNNKLVCQLIKVNVFFSFICFVLWITKVFDQNFQKFIFRFVGRFFCAKNDSLLFNLIRQGHFKGITDDILTSKFFRSVHFAWPLMWNKNLLRQYVGVSKMLYIFMLTYCCNDAKFWLLDFMSKFLRSMGSV